MEQKIIGRLLLLLIIVGAFDVFSQIKDVPDKSKVQELIHSASDSLLAKETEKKDLPSGFNLKLNDLSIFPNPTKGELKVRFNLNQTGSIRLNVLDILGNVVYSGDVEGENGIYVKSLDLRDQPRGLYFVQIKQKNNSMTRKIIIE